MNELMKDIMNTADSFVKNFSEDALYNMSSMIGCYVFETARRNYGGEYLWVRECRISKFPSGLGKR